MEKYDKKNVMKMQDIDSSKCGRDLSANKLCIYILLTFSPFCVYDIGC
jgi:hypothetical protein